MDQPQHDGLVSEYLPADAELELKLQQRSGKEVNSAEIGEFVLRDLKQISEVAYIRFASVYRQFRGIDDFVSTLETLNADQGQNHLATVR